jgi:hypothetical protein
MRVMRIKASMSVDEHLSRSRAGRKMLVAEKQCAEDAAEVIQFERWWSERTGNGPSTAALVAAWRKSRDSWLRITQALSKDSALREAMFDELAKREVAFDALADEAEALLKEVEANGK